jgi:Family of unknown function (DUF5367)
MRRFLFLGFGIWLGGTVVLRVVPVQLLPPFSPERILVLYAASFGLTFFIVRQFIARRLQLPEARGACIALVLATLLLDPFSAAFFTKVFPNWPAEAAGVFGGWMLVFCAGALLPVLGKE